MKTSEIGVPLSVRPPSNGDRRVKTFPLQAYGGPKRSERLRLPDSVTLVGCQPYALAVFTPRSILVLIFKRLSQPWAHGIVGWHGKNPQ
jgi:hypothetical protein